MQSGTITFGGIRIDRDNVGNLTIYPRGDGFCHVQRADIPDLIEALRKLEAGEISPLSRTTTK